MRVVEMVLAALLLIPLCLLIDLLMFAWATMLPAKFGVVKKAQGEENEESGKSTAIYVNHLTPRGPLQPSGTMPHTLYEVFRLGVKVNASGNCLGYRHIGADGKAGDFVWETYEKCFERARNFGAGLTGFGLVPPNDENLKVLGIFMKNRKEWSLAEHGCYMYKACTAPLYDTLGPETVEYVINQTQMATVLCSDVEVKHLIAVKPRCPSLRNIIRADSTPNHAISQQLRDADIKEFTFEQVEQQGAEHGLEISPPSPDDIATFCYTSGTTDLPKGALLSHSNFAAMLAAVHVAGIKLHPEDRYLSYLPLAHVLERAVVTALLAHGSAIGFYQGDARELTTDLKSLKPTLFVSVPRLYNRVYEGIMNKISKSKILKAVVDLALAHKRITMIGYGTSHHLFWDTLVFKRISAEVGLDKCRMMATGSAPIAPHVLEFLRAAFSSKVLEGYGSTESTALVTLTDPGDYSTSNVGGPLPCAEVRLEAVPDLDYLPSDKFHRDSSGNKEPCMGRGEICFRGGAVFKGYYKQPAKTREAIDEDGWVHTGDIGLWLSGGRLKIVDRKKNIFKLSQGEYIAPEKIENAYISCPLVNQVFVYGDSLQSVLVAIVVPEEHHLRKFVGATDKTFEELCASAEVTKSVLEEMTKAGKSKGLLGFELVKDIYLTATQFTVENGMYTATFKLKRAEAKKYFWKEIQRMYTAQAGIGGITRFQS